MSWELCDHSILEDCGRKKRWSNKDRARGEETDAAILKKHPVFGAREACDRCLGLTYSKETNDDTAEDPVAHDSVGAVMHLVSAANAVHLLPARDHALLPRCFNKESCNRMWPVSFFQVT